MPKKALHDDLFAAVPAHWNVVPLTDVVDFQEGPGILAKDFHGSGVPLLRLKSIQGRFATLDGADRLDPKMVERRWSHFSLEIGDLLVSTSATIGIVSEVSPATQGAIAYTGIIRMRPKRQTLDRAFLRHFLKSSLFATQAERMASGSVMAHYGPTHLRQMSLVLPPLSEQRVITQILDGLDDKIELNRTMSAVLETMARALFKSWFVDFDPVRTKAEGRTACLAPDILSLFPDRLDDEGKPEGWERIALREAADVLSGGTPPKSSAEFWNGPIPWISPKVMMNIHVFDSNDRVTSEAIGHGTRVAVSGSVLLMVRGMGLHQGVRISQARRDVTFNQDVKALVPKRLSGTHLLFGMLDAAPYLFSKVQASGHGTGTLPTDIIDSIYFITPTNDDLCAKLMSPLEALNDRIATSSAESATLSIIRDALLPKLISGELRVGESERVLAESA